MKKSEEQARVVSQTAEFPDSTSITVGSSRGKLRLMTKNQMDFMFIGAEGTFVDEPRVRTTVHMVICKDDGNLSVTEVCVRKLMSTA